MSAHQQSRVPSGSPRRPPGGATKDRRAEHDALLGLIRGPVVRAGEARFDAERTGFQTAWARRPAVIVGATQAADVRAAVEYAGERGLSVSVQATGHGLSSEAPAGGLMIATGRMAGVAVDPVARTAWVEAGARWDAVIEAAARYGLAPPSGSAPHLNAIAYTLGGGLGLLGRAQGWAAEHVRALDVVTPDARLRHVTAESDPDLFWGLRGGRDGLGVVTGMRIGLSEVTRLYGGTLTFDAGRAGEVVAAYLDWTASAPEGSSSSVAVISFPDSPDIPAEQRGRRIVQVHVAHLGDPADGERRVAPLRRIGGVTDDALRDMTFAESDVINADPTEPHAYQGDNAMLTGPDWSAADTVLSVCGPEAPVMCVVQVTHLGGALGRPPGTADAVGHREARYLLGVLSPVTISAAEQVGVRRVGAGLSNGRGRGDGNDVGGSVPAPAARVSDIDVVLGVHASALEAVRPSTAGRGLNFLFGRVTADQLRTAHRPDVRRRLTALRAHHDPAGLFDPVVSSGGCGETAAPGR
ncbi:FAD-binding oxidoreductase [Actinoalloteichus fjordicus]|uniref:FAD binding protein n=1 Tax=Actinoalloteichus fjordicus TaxID=1612552 RepID=A0AAC9PSM3_9PSEU|nr:FAD-dependent oxidoreductase [Actinoalloteichus fjordicus]APU14991.1 FAD binding protein [Actinoalloteichus fjordicus]